MRQGTITTVAPVGHPLSLAAAKRQLKIEADYTADDDDIGEAIAAAHRLVERELGYPILRQTRQTHLSGFPNGAIWLAAGDSPEIVSIQYRDTANVLQTLDPGAYSLDAISLPAKVWPAPGTTWPATVCTPGAVIVTWRGGWADAASVPEDLIHAMKLLVGHWDRNRDGEDNGPVADVMRRLMAQFRLNFIA